MSQVYVSYPPGPLVRQGGDSGVRRAGQRMPDINVSAAGQATTLHGVLRGGRHVLVTPAAPEDPALQPYRGDLEIVTPMPAPGDKASGPIFLVRPDGHVAAHGRPGSMDAVTGYLRDLFREPASLRDDDAAFAQSRVAAAAHGGQVEPLAVSRDVR